MSATVTTWNKGKTLEGATGWNLTPDVRAGLESMNVVVPVANKDERDGLTPPQGKYAGMTVARTDLPGCPLETWDGTKWPVSDVPLTTIAPIAAHLFSAVTTGGWGGIKYSVRNSTVFVGGAVTRGTSWGADQDLVQMPAGLYPPFKIQGVGCQVGTNGILTLPAGGVAASFSASWTLI